MYHATKNNAVLNLTSSRSCGRRNMRDIKTLLTAPISRISSRLQGRDDEGRKDEVSYIGKQAAEDSRQQPSGMTTNFNNTPLIRPYGAPSPSRGKDTIYPPRPRGRGWHVMPGEGGYSHGFTLIELLIVVLIIAILAAIALPQYQRAILKTKYAALKPMVESISEAEELYYLANGTYTNNTAELDLSLPQAQRVSTERSQWIYHYPGRQCRLVSDSVWCLVLGTTTYAYGKFFKNITGDRAGKAFCAVSASIDSNSINDRICQQETKRENISAISSSYRFYYY